MERVPWTLTEWHEQVVAQSEGWWLTAKPLMEAFWVDVERAKVDATFLEEHLKKKEKEDKCLIRLPMSPLSTDSKTNEIVGFTTGITCSVTSKPDS